VALHAQNTAQAKQISSLTARLAEVEAKLVAPDKTPDNSSLPPSKGQRPTCPSAQRNLATAVRVARMLAERPDRIIEATLAACPHCAHAFGPTDLPEIHAYGHIAMGQ
jgi:transposase